MKKTLISLIFAIAMIFTTSCGSLKLNTSIYDDPNDSFYITTSPYYHRQHYYNDYYYDRRSNYYQKQHFYRNEGPTVIIRGKSSFGNRNNANRNNNGRSNNRRKK